MSTTLIFPTTIPNPSYPLSEDPENNSLVSSFEDGSVQGRPKFTRNRFTWTLKWEKLKDDKYQILKDFIVNTAKYSANSFLWTHPVTGKTYEVYIKSVTKPQLVTLNYWEVEFEIQEV
jgi:phage-related protein